VALGVAIRGYIVQDRFNSLARGFGDLVVDVLKSNDQQELDDFLVFLITLETSIKNAREDAQDRLQKLKIAKRWESPN